MTSIEYINNDIKTCKRLIKRLEESIDTYDEVLQGPLDPIDQRFYRPKQDFIDQLDRYKNTLNILQQIKTILEAWYAVKKHLESFSADYFNGITENGILMTSKVNENEYQIIKKALEVKDGK